MMSDYSPGTVFEFDPMNEAFDLSSFPDSGLENNSNSGSNDATKKKTTRTLAPNLTRRSHKKSRGGCFSCKTRKIKCQETRPACSNCLSKDLVCKYPTRSEQRIVRRPSNTSGPSDITVAQSEPRLDLAPLSPPTTFTMADMRCFHHYMTHATPHLPLGNESVWLNQVPEIAQDHEYLMHALLALGGSHLTRVSDQGALSTSAIVHRGKAITGLNEALARGSNDPRDADAMLAACYALTFQASYMGDGMADFIAMVRGCALLHEQITRTTGEQQSKFRIGPDFHMDIMESRMSNLPGIDPAFIDPGIAAVEALRPLLRGNMGGTFHASLLQVLYALRVSPKAGYMNFVSVYGTFFDMPHSDFAAFINPDNVVPQLLMAHFISLQMLVTPLTLLETDKQRNPSGARVLLGTAEWADRIIQKTPVNMRGYVTWVQMIVGAMKHDIEILLDGRYKTVPLKIISGKRMEVLEEPGDDTAEEEILRTTGAFADIMVDQMDLESLGTAGLGTDSTGFGADSTVFGAGDSTGLGGLSDFDTGDI